MRRWAAMFALAGALAACATVPETDGSYLRGFARAEQTGATFAPITEVEPGVDLARAYALQHQVVATRLKGGDRAAGYKGGLMSAKSLADRQAREPLTGVLFTSGDVASGGTVSLCGYRRAAFELKLGYMFAAPVHGPVATVEALRSKVAAVQPVVELPDIAYRDDKSYGALDMVAANISSAKFVRGTPRAADAIDLDGLRAAITREGTSITQGAGRESLDGQWPSLLRVVNLIVAHGGQIQPGQIVLTGKIGDKGDLPPGDYRADYGALGEVRFRVAACAARAGA